MDIRIECHGVHVVPGISGSYCDNCTGRETEVGRRRGLCHSKCQWEKPLLDPVSPPATLPVLLETADENRGTGIAQACVLILPCFLLVWGKTLFLSEPLFLHLYNG